MKYLQVVSPGWSVIPVFVGNDVGVDDDCGHSPWPWVGITFDSAHLIIN